MGKIIFVIVLLFALTFQVGATENYIYHEDNRVDAILRDFLQKIDNMLANHCLGACEKLTNDYGESRAYQAPVACATSSDDIAVVTCEIVLAGVITSIDATAEVAAWRDGSFDTVEAGDQCNILVEYDGTSFYVTQGDHTQDSTETLIVPKATEGRCPIAVINVKTTDSISFVPGDDWDKAGVSTTVRIPWFSELVW